MRTRRGFTIIELLVAITLIALGVLSLARMSSVVMRNLTAGAQQTIAATLAQSRIEMLRSQQCDKLAASGSTGSRGMSEKWKVTTQSRSKNVIVTVTYSDGRQPRLVEYRSVIPCPILQ